MMTSNKNNIWQKRINIAMEIIWLLIIIVVPLYFDQFIFNPWEMAKNILFQILTEILLALFLIKLILAPQPIINQQHFKYIFPGFIFIFILGLSTLLSQVPWFSFWGSWERRMGYLAWLHFFVFAIILFLNLKNQKQVKRIIISILITSSVVVIYGFLQIFGLDPFHWIEEPFFTYRIFSTIGQPNFLGSWLILIIPVVLYSLLIFKKFIIRSLIAILLISLLICLIFTQSRGAWFGLIAQLFFFGLILLWLKKKKHLSFVLISMFIISICSLIYFNLHPIKLNVNTPIINRLETLTNLKLTGKYRLMHWQASLDIIKNRPVVRLLLGSGLGSQRFNLPKYYQPKFAIYEAPNTYLDYAHNDILDTLLTSGILGLLSYLLLIASIFYLGFKKIRSDYLSKYPLIPFLLTGLFGYLVSIQFSFHVMSTLLYFWLLTILIFKTKQANDKTNNQLLEKKYFLSFNKIFLIILIILTTTFLIWHCNFNLYLASHYLLKATISKLQSDWSAMIDYHQAAVKYQPNNPYFRQQFALDLYYASINSQNPSRKLELLNLAIENIKKIPKNERPIEALIWQTWFWTERANLTQNRIDFQTTEKIYQEVSNFTPGTALIYKTWCQLKINQQNWSEAIKMCNYALSLYPDINHPHLNSEHRLKIIDEMAPIYLYIGDIYFHNQNYEKALANYQQALHLLIEVENSRSLQLVLWEKMANINYQQKNINQAIDKILHCHTLDPENPHWLSILSFLYQEINDLEKAKLWSNKISIPTILGPGEPITD